MVTKSIQEQLQQLKQKTEFKKTPAHKETIDLRTTAVREKQDKQAASKANEKAERFAHRAKVKELIAKHRKNDDKAEIPHHFQCGAKIKRVFVTAEQQEQLKTGALVVMIYGGRHQLLPPDIAQQIKEMIPELPIITEFGSDSDLPEDYKDFEIPDDLMW